MRHDPVAARCDQGHDEIAYAYGGDAQQKGR